MFRLGCLEIPNTSSFELEGNRQRRVFRLFVGFSIFGLTVFGVSHFFVDRWLHGVLNLGAAAAFSVLLLAVRRPGWARATYRVFVFLALALFLFWVREGGTGGQPAAAMWIYVFPLLSLFLLGKKEGFVWTSLLVLGILLQFFLLEHLQKFSYVTDFKIRYIGSLVLVAILAYNYEAIRAAYWDRIMRHQGSLETLVAKRTLELREANAELSKSEYQYRILADNASDLIWKIDLDLEVKYISPSVEHLCGYTVSEAMGRPLDEWFPPESYQKLRRVLDEQRWSEISENGPGNLAITLELEQCRKDKSVFPVELKLSPVRENGPKTVGLLGISRDISERKERQELMIQTEKMISLGGLAAGIAHEIKNPLAATLQSIELIRDRLVADSPQNRAIAQVCKTDIESVRCYLEKRRVTEILDSAADSSERLSTVVKTMLGFSRQSESAFSMHDLRDLLEKAVVLASTDLGLSRDCNFRGIDIVRKYDEQVPKVPCDPVKIQQVFFNLLKNGAEAMRQKEYRGGAPRFVLGVAPQKDAVRVEIEDNGPGLDKETKAKIFEPFFTTKSDGCGTGLGLSLSYFIITENHRGHMTVETEKGNWTRFVITLASSEKGPPITV